MAEWIDSTPKNITSESHVSVPAEAPSSTVFTAPASVDMDAQRLAPPSTAAAPAIKFGEHGWPFPSSILPNPDEARACIQLPEFKGPLLEKARAISAHFPAAEVEYRTLRGTGASAPDLEIPHFERVFRLAAALTELPDIQEAPDYDALLILTAWLSVRPGVEGYLGSFPKALLCPLSHTSPPAAVASLSPRDRAVFERRAPAYLRYLLCYKFNLRTCADIENADLRHLLKTTGFRLVRPSAAAEVAYPGITQGEDPAVRPWKLTLRQELSDERAAELLHSAALWQVRYGLGLVSFEEGQPRWNIGAFARTDWEDAFLSLGVRVAPSLQRDSGLLDWRAVLSRCLDTIGRGNLPPEVLGKVSAWPQRICHDDDQAIWNALDQVACTVVQRSWETEPRLFNEDGGLEYEFARSFRGWVRLFDEVSPQILSRFGVSAFTALHRVAPRYFGWGCGQLKPWELEQEHGKWKGPRGRAMLRSAYAYALFECGLGTICGDDEQLVWRCTESDITTWFAGAIVEPEITPYDFLYGLASRHGLTPLLNREVTHTAVISLLAGMNLHENLPRIEGCWEVCLRAAVEQNGGELEVQLVVPDLVPLPLRLRKAVLAPLTYSYLHKELRLIRDFDLRLARETRCKLEEIPGWLEDERIAGTPLLDKLESANRDEHLCALLRLLNSEPWLESPARRIRFRALQLLLSKRATLRDAHGEGGLTSEEIRRLLRLALEATLEHTNVLHVSLPAVRRGFERILARDDTREMLESLLLHIGAAYETEVWGQVRKFIVLDVINDVVGLTVRSCLLHKLSER